MVAIRMICKECDEDMTDFHFEDITPLIRYLEYRCPECGLIIGVEIEQDGEERAQAVLHDDDWIGDNDW